MPGLRSFGPARLGLGILAQSRRIGILNGKLTAAGDSNTAIPGQNGTDSWVTRLIADAPLLTCVSLGIGGMTVADMDTEKSNSNPAVGVYVNFDGAKPFNVATLMGGTNDIATTSDTAATMYSHYTSWNAGVKGANPSCLTIAMTVLWGSNHNAGQLVRLDAFNALIMANAAGFNAVFDAYTALGTNGANFSDGYHTSTAGAQLISTGMVAKLLTIIP